MSDTRELILVRLTEIAAGLVEPATDGPVIKTTWRNKLDISEADQPAICIMDGDEEPVVDPEGPGKPRLASSLQMMQPEIVLITQAPAEHCGGELNAMRAAFLNAMLGDATLIALAGPNGFLRYLGCRTRIQISAQTDARMLVMVGIGYIVKPSAL